MGSNESETLIPYLDFSMNDLALEEGSEEWKKMSMKVREACENYGCFILMYDKIPKGLYDDMLKGMKELFDLPEETKRKHICSKPYRSYNGDCPFIPLCQSFGIDDAPFGDIAQDFTNLMWPQGNPSFCETMKSMSSKMLELNFLILKMILEGYGLQKQHISDIEDMKSTSNFRVIKYKVPQSDKDSCEVGLLPHTDKSALTILCQNQVQGLEVLITKTNKWIPLNIPQNGFVVLVGDTLKAWSNGRLHAVSHRVIMSGDEERYSFALFALPKEDMKIEVPAELVDDKTHPLRYRPFSFGDYLQYFVSTNKKDNALDVFAGV